MKFIKYAVGLVIALSVIPMVVVAVNKLDQPKLKTVTFEVVGVDIVEETITFSDNTYTDLYNVPKVLSEFDPITNEVDIVTNLITARFNNYTLDDIVFIFNHETEIFSVNNTDDYDWYDLSNNNIASDNGYLSIAQVGDKWQMTFEVPSQVSPLVKTLIGFAPLLFIGGVLVFMLNKRKFD